MTNRDKAWKSIENGTHTSKNQDSLRAYLREHRGNRCEYCKLDTWMGKEIPLEIHHEDGNWKNNKLENVKLICLNCHGQTPSYRSRNSGKGRNFRYGYKK